MVPRAFIAAACGASLAVVAPPAVAGSTPPGAALTIGSVAHRSAGGAASVVKLVGVPARPASRPARPAARPAHPLNSRATRATRATPRRSRAMTGLSARVTGHTAGDPGVTVADFHFSPASTTIHVGDTITWTNDGPSSHTATARDGGFDTGVLKKGHSASHTFTQSGTFTYFCQIHPFMHGTIVVLAASTTTTAATTSTPAATTPAATPSTAAPTATTAATAAAARTGPTLPNTGFNVAAGLGAGLLLLGAGAALRRARPR
jgi:LPXTG-motif cell wall-anchored protein